MYDRLKGICNSRINYFEKYYTIKTTQQKIDMATGSIRAYKDILKEINNLEEYINKKNSTKFYNKNYKYMLKYNK